MKVRTISDNKELSLMLVTKNDLEVGADFTNLEINSLKFELIKDSNRYDVVAFRYQNGDIRVLKCQNNQPQNLNFVVENILW